MNKGPKNTKFFKQNSRFSKNFRPLFSERPTEFTFDVCKVPLRQQAFESITKRVPIFVKAKNETPVAKLSQANRNLAATYSTNNTNEVWIHSDNNNDDDDTAACVDPEILKRFQFSKKVKRKRLDTAQIATTNRKNLPCEPIPEKSKEVIKSYKGPNLSLYYSGKYEAFDESNGDLPTPIHSKEKAAEACVNSQRASTAAAHAQRPTFPQRYEKPLVTVPQIRERVSTADSQLNPRVEKNRRVVVKLKKTVLLY